MNRFLIDETFDTNAHADWIAYRKPVLPFYDDYCFIREIETSLLLRNTLSKFENATEVWHSPICTFLINYLSWDTNYFGIDTFKITGCLFGDGDKQQLLNEFKIFFQEFYTVHPACRIVAEIPSEDFEMLQGLSFSGLRLIEGRLIHFKHPLRETEKVAYRKANRQDAENLGRVASKMRNPADRFHADMIFDNTAADEYLYTYAKACVEGFTDVVIVPDEPGVPSNSFIAINYRVHDRKWNVLSPAQIVLTAVDSDTNKGWYKKLIHAAVNHVIDEGAGCLYNTTQITNKAVIYTLESLGFKLGCTRMLFTN